MRAELSDPETCEAVAASFAQMREFIEEFAPDVIVQFSPDHFNGFNYALMPSFSIGLAARSCGDWSTRETSLPVDERFASDILGAVRAAEIDAAMSYDMVVDHGFVQMWEIMFGRADKYPIVPIFVNCAAPPLPTYPRARALGKAVGEFAARSGQRVLFAASGGLSHDPLVPKISDPYPETRARLLGTALPTAERKAQREARLLELGAAAQRGEGPLRPLNPDWDLLVLDAFARNDWQYFGHLDADKVERIAGSGANELLAWVAAASAMAAAGPYRVVQKQYRPAPGWIAGVAHLTATSA
jgi:2,3-dihydroxyphenylpropionate 1,2-dioxygenase